MAKERPTIAVQMYSVDEHLQTVPDFENTLRRRREVGYEAVQYANRGVLGGDEPEIDVGTARRMLDDNGLACLSERRPWSALRGRTQSEIKRAQTPGCEVLYVNFLEPPYDRFDPASYRAFARDSLPVVEAMESAGLSLGYHNHAHELFHPKTGGESIYDLLLREFDPRIAIEPDVYWIAYAGANPATWLRNLSGRVKEAHVKGAEVVPDDRYEMVKLFFAPVGEGNLDWDTIIPAGREAGVQTWIVEQDICQRDAFDCMRSSYEFLAARA